METPKQWGVKLLCLPLCRASASSRKMGFFFAPSAFPIHLPASSNNQCFKHASQQSGLGAVKLSFAFECNLVSALAFGLMPGRPPGSWLLSHCPGAVTGLLVHREEHCLIVPTTRRVEQGPLAGVPASPPAAPGTATAYTSSCSPMMLGKSMVCSALQSCGIGMGVRAGIPYSVDGLTLPWAKV